MDQVSQVVLALLRSALWGEEHIYPADTDWNAVTKELNAQAIMGLVGGSVTTEDIPEDTRAQWEALVMRQGARFYKLLHEQDEMLALLDKNEIHPVILKGTAAAVYYPDPEMRAMGDIDFLVPRDQVEKACQLMLANDYELFEEIDAVDKHITLKKAGVHFELHRYFGKFDQVDRMEFMDAMLQDGMRDSSLRLCCGSTFPILPQLANGLVLLEHAASHMRDGLGLRHITDWMLYVHACLTDAYWEEVFCPAAQALGLDVLAKTMTRMCQRYLGLSSSIHWCQDASMEDCDQLMAYVLEQGNFGRKKTDVGSKVTRLLASHNRIGDWLRTLQLSGMNHWGAVNRYPFLKPFAWIYGICRYVHLALGRKNALTLIRQEKQKGDQREAMCEKLGVRWSDSLVILQGDQFIEQKFR